MVKQSNTFTILHAVMINGKNILGDYNLSVDMYKSDQNIEFKDTTKGCFKSY